MAKRSRAAASLLAPYTDTQSHASSNSLSKTLGSMKKGLAGCKSMHKCTHCFLGVLVKLALALPRLDSPHGRTTTSCRMQETSDAIVSVQQASNAWLQAQADSTNHITTTHLASLACSCVSLCHCSTAAFRCLLPELFWVCSSNCSSREPCPSTLLLPMGQTTMVGWWLCHL